MANDSNNQNINPDTNSNNNQTVENQSKGTENNQAAETQGNSTDNNKTAENQGNSTDNNQAADNQKKAASNNSDNQKPESRENDLNNQKQASGNQSNKPNNNKNQNSNNQKSNNQKKNNNNQNKNNSNNKKNNNQNSNNKKNNQGGKKPGNSSDNKKQPEKVVVDKEKLKRELNEANNQETTSENPEAMGKNLKSLLKKEINDYKKREKTRAAEMISIFSAHNFYANGFTPEELRTTLEDLGPTYVKIGQIMSSRVDLLPESYCKELEKLRQSVKPLDPEVARAVIEEETGKKIDEIYSEFRDKPLGSASIGQVHYAVLKDGTKVVTKVQRPLIADMMRKDYVLLKKLAGLVNSVSDNEDGEGIDLVSVIEELEKVTDEELDFRVEANNTKFFKENCIDDEEKITCPTVIDELTTERIFTMTFVDGYSIAKKDRLISDGYDPLEVGKVIAENYVHQVLDIGTFHADPHQGNIMFTNGKPCWIDFGMIGHISDKDIDTIQGLIISLLAGDSEGMVKSIFSMGAASTKTNRDALTEDVTTFLSGYDGASGIDDIDMGVLFDEITELTSKHHITLPGQYTMLGRSLITIEGVIEQLCPELDLFTLLSNAMIERSKKGFDLKKTLLDAGKELVSAGKKTAKIPGFIAETLGALAKGKAKINIELAGIDEPLERIGIYIKYVVMVIVACVLFIGSCILASVDIQPKTTNGMPLLAVGGIVFSIALTIYSIGKLTKKK
ncbi:MAG: AarF/UbiB family protein [Ruminococcus sp.]|nr:AarF/UbiB family protein [Ruminococcus sp.]